MEAYTSLLVDNVGSSFAIDDRNENDFANTMIHSIATVPY